MPVAAEPVEDDEDTLSGLDPVPVVDTAVIPAAVVRGATATGGRRRSRAPAEAIAAGPAAHRARPADRRADRARGVGALTLSLRNRELLNLIAVGLLTAIGFASVYIARSSLVDAAR